MCPEKRTFLETGSGSDRQRDAFLHIELEQTEWPLMVASLGSGQVVGAEDRIRCRPCVRQTVTFYTNAPATPSRKTTQEVRACGDA